MIAVVIFLTALLADQIIKRVVRAKLPKGQQRAAFGGRVLFRRLDNPGMAFGTGKYFPKLVKKVTTALVAIVTFKFLFLLPKEGRNGEKAGLALILAGGTGNLIDRCCEGTVTDYISFRTRIRAVRKLVFNLADFCIFAGAVIALVSARKRLSK